MVKKRKTSPGKWAGQALLAAYELLAGDDRQREAVMSRCGLTDLSGEDACTEASRHVVLDALHGQWASGDGGQPSRVDASLHEVVAFLPDVPACDGDGLYSAEAIFRFAERAEGLMDYIVVPRSGTAGKPSVKTSNSQRKARGMYFTPYDLAAHMVDRCLAPVLESLEGPIGELLGVRVLDPAMGTGRFLVAAAERIAGEAAADTAEAVLDIRRKVVESCLFGVDRSAFAVTAARYGLGLYAGAELGADTPHLRPGDSLVGPEAAKEFAWEGGFPEGFFTEGDVEAEGGATFDAIVGNPPYVATKNEPSSFYSPYLGKAGQSDYYLLFIHKYAAKKYLRPGGAVSFVVPDPLLCRGNAESARLRLLEEVHLVSLVHAKGIFPEAGVANVVFLGRRRTDSTDEERKVHVVRLESREACRHYLKGDSRPAGVLERDVPIEVFRSTPAKEFRYLLSEGAENVIARLDTKKPPHKNCGVVVRSLGSIASARGSIFRGEEIGKAKIRTLVGKNRAGGVPILLGGENVHRYAVRDDGFFIPSESVRKDVNRYRRQKILVQKSTGRLVAALDRRGFVFPQSVYGILVNDPRIGYAFLLAQLNSHLINFYVRVMFTGYKLVQPQIEIEDIKRLPVIVPEFEESVEARQPSLESAKGLYKQFLETDDPGWMIEYLEESLKLKARRGSALIHDLLEFLGMRMIETSASGASPERERLEWLIDLLIYRICGLEVEEVELVESYFEEAARNSGAESEATRLSGEDPDRRDPALWKKEESRLYGGRPS